MYTTYFKGRKARRESADGKSIVIYDRDADKVYTLDPTAKTYYSVSYTSLIGDNADQNAGPFQTTSKLNLKSPTAGAGTVGGIATRDFGVDGTLTMTPPAGGFGGGRRGGQAQGGAATATPQGGNAGATDPNAQGGRRGGGFGGFAGITTAVTGSISLASAAAVLPTELSGAAYDRTLSLPLIDQVLPANNQMFKPLVASIARQQGIPLGAKITMQRTIQMAPAMANGNTDTTAQTPPTVPPTTITMEVQSVDKTATLEDALFAVPTDYKVVDAPTQGFGRGGWGGRGGGAGGQGGQNGQNGQGARRGRNRGGAAGVQNPAAL